MPTSKFLKVASVEGSGRANLRRGRGDGMTQGCFDGPIVKLTQKIQNPVPFKGLAELLENRKGGTEYLLSGLTLAKGP
jgi:hypothetical protein